MMEKPFIHCCISQTVPCERGASGETWGLGYLRKDGWKESAYFKYSARCNVAELLLRRLVCALTQFTDCSSITAAIQETGMWLLLWMEGSHMLLPFWNYQSYFALCVCACVCARARVCVCSDCFHCRNQKKYWKPRGASSYLQQRLHEGKDGQSVALKLLIAFQHF